MSLASGNIALLRQLGAFRHASSLLRLRTYATVDSTATETHDDFKPKYNVPPVNDVEQQIKKDITSNQVFLYMKGVPAAPNCGFSDLACKILHAYQVKYGSANVLADPALREGVKKFSKWPTIPQIYVQGEFVGGADILMSMHESGELEKLLAPIRKAQGGPETLDS